MLSRAGRFLLALIMLLMFSGGAVLVSAQGFDPLAGSCDTPETRESLACKSTVNPPTTSDNVLIGPDGIITKVTSLLSLGIGIASIIIIMYGGLRYILSGNDSANINKAKDTVFYAVIGIIVAVAAQAIVVFVLNRI